MCKYGIKYNNICHIKNFISPTSGKKTLHTWSYYRYQFHLLFPHWHYHHPRLILYQHSQSPCWHQLVQQMETVLITYNFLNRSLFIHAAPIRFPKASSSMIQKFQTLQNSAFSIATGCVKMACIDHLPEETKVLPIHNHLFISLFFLNISQKPFNLTILPKM